MDENTLFPYTPYLFQIGEPNILETYDPQPIATAVLIHYQYPLLITTRKTIQKYGKYNVGICFKPDGIERLAGKVEYHTDENIDIAVIKLDDNLVEMLKSQYLFLNNNSIDFNHEFHEYNFYTLFGGLNHITSAHKTKNIFNIEFLNHTTSYKAFSKKDSSIYNVDQHVLFDKARVQRDIDTWNRELGVKYLDGIQGGGVWIEESAPEGEPIPKLVAIMVEGIPQKATVVAVKIKVIREILRERFQIDI